MVQKRMNFSERKQAIIEAAIPLFSKLGFKNTTTKEIAQCAGVSEALLYKHFSSKNDLYDFVQQKFCEASQTVANLLSLKKPGAQNLINAVTLLALSIIEGFDGADELNMVRRLILNSLLDEGDFARNFHAAHIEIWLDKIQENYLAAIDEGAIIDGVEADKDFFLFVHNFLFGSGVFSLPKNKIINYQSTQEKFLEKSILFSLRGMGFKETAIKKYFNINEVLSLINKGK